MSIYEDSVEEDPSNSLRQFQTFLKQIPNWNQTILDQETARIKEKCPYLMDMVTAIFVSHVKILASVRLGGKHSNIKIKIPTPEIFIHSIYVAGAECFYYTPEPFEDSLDRGNTEIIKDTIYTNIDNTISSMIPIQSILQEYLCNTFTDHVKQPVNPEEPQKEEDIGDILSGNDIMGGIVDDIDKIPTPPLKVSDDDIGGLFDTPPVTDTVNDPIFSIGDSPSFEDKIGDDLGFSDMGSMSGDDEIKEIPVDGFMGSSLTDSSPLDDNIPPLSMDTPTIPVGDFGIPDEGGSSDFNFFDTNDTL